MTLEENCWAFATVSASLIGFLPTRHNCMPWRDKATAMARPTPLLAPVTTAIRPVRLVSLQNVLSTVAPDWQPVYARWAGWLLGWKERKRIGASLRRGAPALHSSYVAWLKYSPIFNFPQHRKLRSILSGARRSSASSHWMYPWLSCKAWVARRSGSSVFSGHDCYLLRGKSPRYFRRLIRRAIVHDDDPLALPRLADRGLE
jgi:hypothetical protein